VEIFFETIEIEAQENRGESSSSRNDSARDK